ncbi:hypothetical protein P2L57_39420, partial [Streptomyces ferralitis]|nr:hypothetical protein [Streptantibioticus ferralitis]
LCQHAESHLIRQSHPRMKHAQPNGPRTTPSRVTLHHIKQRHWAARTGRGIISGLPGFRTGDALASAVLTAAAPTRMAVYDRRVQHALDTLGLTLTPAPGRYGRYMQLLHDLLKHGGAHTDAWTARDIDTALYWTGNTPHQPPTT